jgi:protein-S-isoprenylcysteine O-methyltransferase Ste14
MLIDQWQYELTILIWLIIAISTFILLMFIRAPYGRHERPGWGPRLPSRLGWIIMESPCILIMTVFFGFGVTKWSVIDFTAIIFYTMWIAHYIHRSWVWPARAKITGKRMPLSIVLFAVAFNSINAWINAEWIYSLHHPYPNSWIYSPQFIIGFILFLFGMGLNIKSDNILFSLRSDGNSDYKIPREGLFKWVSCPNYFGEIIEWCGWAIATWSLAGLSFAIWGMANLIPRARSNHKWYIEHFPDYPATRKTLIPKIW